MDHVMYANQKRVGWCKGYLQPTSSANTIGCVSVFTSSSALPSNKPQKTETNHTIPHVLKNFI